MGTPQKERAAQGEVTAQSNTRAQGEKHTPDFTHVMAGGPVHIRPWMHSPVVTFMGQYDSHASEEKPHLRGRDYRTLTLAEVFEMEPACFDKGDGPAMIPSSYFEWDARTHDVQRQRGSFVALTGDIDKGSPSIEAVESAVRGFVGEGVGFLIYSSSSASAEVKKWRIVIPLENPAGFEQWENLQTVFFTFMEAQGLAMDWALARAAQPVYLPNVPPSKRGADGMPLFFEKATVWGRGLRSTDPVVAACLEDLCQQIQAQESAAAEAREAARIRARNRQESGAPSVIEAFNGACSVEQMLEANGYARGPRDNWRSPHQSSKTFATKNFGDRWVSMSESDAHAGLGFRDSKGFRSGDAFDLFCHFEHAGDRTKAVKAAAQMLGMDRNGNDRTAASAAVLDLEAAKRAQELRRQAGQGLPLAQEPQDASSPLDAKRRIFGAGEFMVEHVPTFWILQKVLAKGWLYALAASPGAGKTAVALLLTLRAAMGQDFIGRKVSQSKVLYLCGENPQDVRGRFDALLRVHGMTLADVEGRIYFTKSPFNIDDPQDLDAFTEDARQYGPFDLCIVDTQKAHSCHEDEDSNSGAHELAQALRRLGADIGNPCVLTLSHPTKTPTRETLLPRGGSAFTGSIDGVLCLWRNDRGAPSELFTHKDKFRGKAFEGVMFKLDEVEHPTLVDNFGDPSTTVVAREDVAQADISGVLKALDGVSAAGVLDQIRERCLKGQLFSKDQWVKEFGGNRSETLKNLNALVTSGQLQQVPAPKVLTGMSREISVLIPASVDMHAAFRAAAEFRVSLPTTTEKDRPALERILQNVATGGDE